MNIGRQPRLRITERPAVQARRADWAQAIVARHGVWIGSRRPLAMPLARLRAALISSREVINRLAVTLAPRIKLGLVVLQPTATGMSPRRQAAANVSSPLATLRVAAAPVPPLIQHLVLRGAGVKAPVRPAAHRVAYEGASHLVLGRWGRRVDQGENTPSSEVHRLAEEGISTRLLQQGVPEVFDTGALTRRLLARGQRLEPGAAPQALLGIPAASRGESGAARSGTSLPEPAASPLPMVLRRPAVVREALKAAGGERAPASRSHRTASPGYQTLAQTTPGLPAMGIEQLTDQVVRTLDQRLTAWRERMGRM